MPLRLDCFCTMLLFLGLRVAAESTAKYSLVVPKSAARGTILQTVLNTYKRVPCVDVTVSDSSSRKLRQFNIINPGFVAGISALQFKIEEAWPEGTYTLNVAACGGSFNAVAYFDVIRKSHSIFVQTDKAVYKPSQTVNVRVLVTTSELKPFRTNVSVTVKDTEGHKIIHWANQTLNLGVASFSLPLSNSPTLGVWSIKVVAADDIAYKKFQVREHVLPRFTLSIKLPSYITASQSHVYGSILALYANGEGVAGMATVKFQIGSKSLIRVIPVSGNETFDLGPNDLKILGLVNSSRYTFEASVNFNETLTGSIQSTSTSVQISPYEAEITFLPATSDYFKRGTAFTAYIKVAHPDGSLLGDPGLELHVVASYYIRESEPILPRRDIYSAIVIEETTVAVPEHGIVAVAILAPDNETNSFNIRATLNYNGQTIESSKNISAFKVQGTNDIRVRITESTDTFKIGDVVTLSVTALQPTGQYYYIAVARGRVASYGATRNGVFSVDLTSKNAPKTTIIAYALGSNDEILADAVTFNVDGALSNKVELAFKDNGGRTIIQATPGSNVTLQVSSDPNSLVGLLSVDQSVLLLGGGNDISQEQLLQELLSYNTRGIVPQPAGGSARQLFADAGLNIVTDATIEGFPSGQPAGESALNITAANTAALESAAIRTRKFSSETWIWSLLQLNSQGNGSIDVTVPDAITSWVTTAFSMNADSGLTVTQSANTLTVFRNFFVSTIVPYSIVRGEETALKAVIFNFLNRPQMITVTLQGSTNFSARISGATSYSLGRDLSITVNASASSKSTVWFWIVPQTIGFITITVAAISPDDRDRFEASLLVKPEGIQQSYCVSDFATLRSTGSYNHTFHVQYPPYIVNGSAKVEIRVSGDIMEPSIQGLDNLVQIPRSCGEQNMITFAPNLFVREYLESVDRLDPVIQEKTQRNMLLGYQRELTYLRSDGFFSAFGNSDIAGSTWLTAFVLKSFRRAQKYLASSIDENILSSTRDWLLSDRYQPNGSFVEKGRVIHVEMQGQSGAALPLTAYVVIALIEDNEQDNATLKTLPASKYLLENSLESISGDVYALAIVTYALHLIRSTKADQALSLLESLAVKDDGALYWTKSSSAQSTVTCQYCPLPRGASAVEMTSYALLTYVQRGDFVKASQVAKWLAGQRNSLGGYTSTQDTVLALQALASYARLHRPSNFSLQISFFSSTKSETLPEIFINPGNSLLLQVVEVQQPEVPRDLTFAVRGQGSAIVSVCVSYNVFEAASQPVVDARVTVTGASVSPSIVQVEVCGKSISQEGAGGMGIIEVELPSGYNVENGAITSASVRRVDYEETKVALYFDEFNSTWICAVVPMQQLLMVNPVMDAHVKVYNYYNPGQYKVVAYNPYN